MCRSTTGVWSTSACNCNPLTTIGVQGAVDAVDSRHPTAVEDADAAPGPTLPVGSPLVLTYLVTNSSTVAFRLVSITDDNATPADTTDDFHPVYVSGDANGNGLVDPGEVWLFTAVGVAGAPQTVLAGGHEHVVVVVGFDPVGRVQVTAADPTDYTGTRPTVQIFKDVNAASPLHPTVTEQADDQVTAPHLAAGAAVVYTYRVITNSPTPVRVVGVIDDNGTATTADDWSPVPVLVTFRGAQYNAGDTDFDGVLEAGEVWLYTSAGVAGAPAVAAQGWHGNIGTLTAADGTGGTYTATNPAWYFGDSGLSLVKAVNAADPRHPTPAEDANSTGPTVAVGSRLVFTYLVGNSSAGAMVITGLVDDNGTATTADDVTLAQMTPLSGADGVHNAGDLNTNGLFDAGETWIFQWTTPAKLGGPFVNTATVTATNGAGQSVTAADIAQYTGLGAHITIQTAVNAADPQHPTVAEDADAAPGPHLQAGTTVVFTSLVTNDGALALTGVVVTDDHGTASTADDFTAVAVRDANSCIVGDTGLRRRAGRRRDLAVHLDQCRDPRPCRGDRPLPRRLLGDRAAQHGRCGDRDRPHLLHRQPGWRHPYRQGRERGQPGRSDCGRRRQRPGEPDVRRRRRHGRVHLPGQQPEQGRHRR
ncbi:hypothetical protein [Microbacterium elymi]|uniref:hypothetical protein n=1 Tax=Microbacterium elymi TaxID=2909587 RepID=UPI003F494E7F